jgi:phospholipid/cholesterol/gamma-HCH transport system substrate-binding protein
MSKRSTPDIGIGLVVMLGLILLVFVSLKAANLTTFSDSDSYRIVARFDNIGGLKVRAKVRSSGFVVGRVKSITLDPKTFQGVVEMAINKDYSFPKDSLAKIQTVGLLGDQYVGLEAGGAAANLQAGDSIEKTFSAAVMEQIIKQFFSGATNDAASTPLKN